MAVAAPEGGFVLLVSPKSLPFVWHSLGPEPLVSCITPMLCLTRGSVIGIALAVVVQLFAPTHLRAVLVGTGPLVEARELFGIQLDRGKEAPYREHRADLPGDL